MHKRRWAYLGQLLKELREANKLTQLELALRSGYKDDRYLRRIEAGKQRPSPEALTRILDDGLGLQVAGNEEMYFNFYRAAGYIPGELSLTLSTRGIDITSPATLRRLFLPPEPEYYWYEQAKLEDLEQIDVVSAAVFKETEETYDWRARAKKQLEAYPSGFYVARTRVRGRSLIIGYAIYFPIRRQLVRLFLRGEAGYGDISYSYIEKEEHKVANYYIEAVVKLKQAPDHIGFKLVRWVKKQIEGKTNLRSVWTISITPEGDDMADLFGLRFYKTIMEKDGETQNLWGLELK